MKRIILFLMTLLSALVLNAQVYTLTVDTIKIAEVTVTGSYTAVKTTPFTFTNLTSSKINLRTNICEPAILLSHTPSVTFYSDNGTGLGYVYFRLRGMDQTRINSTLNGVPLNEPEDQGLYYNNFPDFLGSISSVQIIRGAGLSKNGVANYGGSINFEMDPFTEQFSGVGELGYGSFNTFKISGAISTPNVYFKLTKFSTDGFKKGVFNDSYLGSYGVKLGKFKLLGFVGKQTNGMGWIGAPLDSLKVNPQYNPQTSQETDYFINTHNQLTYNNKGLKVTLYHSFQDGWYNTDDYHYGFSHLTDFGQEIYRIKIKFNWLGGIVNYNYKYKTLNLNTGVGAYTQRRTHEGVILPNTSLYSNIGVKNEAAPYLKIEHKGNRFTLYTDVQYRLTKLNYFEQDTNRFSTTYNFLNYSIGATYRLGKFSNVYFGYGTTYREPRRSDIFGGEYLGAGTNTVIPEKVIDKEIGYRFRNEYTSLNVNFYLMNFEHEIVPSGNWVNGIPQFINANESFRSGIEVDFNWLTYGGLEYSLAGNLSYNRMDGNRVQILTPGVILNGDIMYHINKKIMIGFNTRYNGKSWIDYENTQLLKGYVVLNSYIELTWKNFTLKANFNNLTNDLILQNGLMGYGGSIYDGIPTYFPLAKFNTMVTLKYSF